MHPVAIVIPVAALAFLPSLWAKQLLKRHNAQGREGLPKARELARQLLDEHGLQRVRVECTDLGDHYDPSAKAVRLARDKYDRNTLTAVTTAAHEVAHALQDAADYPPFVWRTRLVSLARVTGQVGSVLLIGVPAAAFTGRRPIPPALFSVPLFAMLATGLAAQFAAVPTEVDASFRRALPLLREKCIDEEQSRYARDILLATASTYVGASLLSVLHLWPWLGIPRRPFPLQALSALEHDSSEARSMPSGTRDSLADAAPGKKPVRVVANRGGLLAKTVRVLGKPLVRGWFQVSSRLPLTSVRKREPRQELYGLSGAVGTVGCHE